MIKLKTNVLKNIIISTLSAFIILFILFSIVFDYSFSNYLNEARNRRFDELKNNISYIMKNNDIDTISKNIGVYAYIENVQVDVFDENNKKIVSYNKINNEDGKLIVSNKYEIISGGSPIGSIIVSYEDKSMISDFALDFRNNFNKIFVALLILSIFIASLTSYMLTSKTSKDIEYLSQMAEDFKNKNYDRPNNIQTNIVEIKNLSDNMTYLGKALKDQEKIRNEYRQNISHELRTPLTNLLLYMEAIKDGVIDFDEDSFQAIQEEIYSMNSLVDDLRRGFNENLALTDKNLEKFNLSDHLKNISKKLSASIRSNNINFSIKIEDGVMVYNDKEKIRQIIYNLISNAVKACDEGDSITLLMKNNKGKIIISVVDSGIGIAEKDLENIFKRDFRVDNERNKKIRGSGLGLSITKDLLSSIGGDISVESKLGKGSNFTIHFPQYL